MGYPVFSTIAGQVSYSLPAGDDITVTGPVATRVLNWGFGYL